MRFEKGGNALGQVGVDGGEEGRVGVSLRRVWRGRIGVGVRLGKEGGRERPNGAALFLQANDLALALLGGTDGAADGRARFVKIVERELEGRARSAGAAKNLLDEVLERKNAAGRLLGRAESERGSPNRVDGENGGVCTPRREGRREKSTPRGRPSLLRESNESVPTNPFTNLSFSTCCCGCGAICFAGILAGTAPHISAAFATAFAVRSSRLTNDPLDALD